MKREQFYEEMKEVLMDLKPEEMEITFMRIDKQNRKGLHGCTLAMPDAAVAPTFYLEDLTIGACHQRGDRTQGGFWMVVGKPRLWHGCDHGLPQ